LIEFHWHELDTQFSPEQERVIHKWLVSLIHHYGHVLDSLSYVFCSDDYLLSLNQRHLQHDDLTDVISFPYATTPNTIEGEIFISVDRVRENAKEYQQSSQRELLRVMAHGLLHFLGHKDKSYDEEEAMRQAEDEALRKLPKALIL